MLWFKKKSFRKEYPEIVKALEFYADPDNWKPKFKPGTVVPISAMMEDADMLGSVAGKKAREILKGLK
jgi:hypothetical protein